MRFLTFRRRKSNHHFFSGHHEGRKGSGWCLPAFGPSAQPPRFCRAPMSSGATG
jgi:hypothetical protein